MEECESEALSRESLVELLERDRGESEDLSGVDGERWREGLAKHNRLRRESDMDCGDGPTHEGES